MKNTLVSLALSGTVLAGASGAQFEFQSGEKQVPLVELYTSEGCSSCPPAEAWMGRLKDAPDLWKGFVPVAFHVDYWNSLGWKDRWSSPEFTERQRAYAEAWKSESVYTPCFVVNGKEAATGPGARLAGMLEFWRSPVRIRTFGRRPLSRLNLPTCVMKSTPRYWPGASTRMCKQARIGVGVCRTSLQCSI